MWGVALNGTGTGLLRESFLVGRDLALPKQLSDSQNACPDQHSRPDPLPLCHKNFKLWI